WAARAQYWPQLRRFSLLARRELRRRNSVRSPAAETPRPPDGCGRCARVSIRARRCAGSWPAAPPRPSPTTPADWTRALRGGCCGGSTLQGFFEIPFACQAVEIGFESNHGGAWMTLDILKSHTLGLLGAGNMSEALARGVLNSGA